MKAALLILVPLLLVSCQSDTPAPPATFQEPVPMGTGRVETKTPEEMRR